MNIVLSIPICLAFVASVSPRRTKKRSQSAPTRVPETKFLRVPVNHGKNGKAPRGTYGICESNKKTERTPSFEEHDLDSFDESDFESSEVESPVFNSPPQLRKTVYFFPPTDNLDLVMEVDDGDSGIEFVASVTKSDDIK